MEYRRLDEIRIREERIDEILEILWMMREEGDSSIKTLLDRSEDEHSSELLKEMESLGLIQIKNREIFFTPAGEKKAQEIIRRHRLAERLLSEVLEVDEHHIEDHACELEHTHVLGTAVVDSICTFLGHPPTCPHGKAIPRGECCKTFTRDIKPLVMPLTDLQIGEKAKIVFISTKYHARLDKLSSLGIIPGSIIFLHQKQPVYIIRSGETELALDRDLAREIFVKRI